MSVINRMLLDIDSRRAAVGVDPSRAHPDIRSVSARPVIAAPGGRWLWVVALFIGVCVTGFVGWREWQERPAANAAPTPMVAQPPPAKAAESAIVAPLPAPALPPVAAAGGSLAVLPPELVSVSPETVGKSNVELSPPTWNAARPSSETLKLSQKLSALVAETPVVPSSAPVTRPVTPIASATTTIRNVPIRQVAADETVLAARAMWSDGAHAGALATLREALARAEASRNTRATLALAKELARLDVADNRAQDALDLLKRLEHLLAEDADACALRGNAEQRLAKHAEAAQSYLAALRIRPTEGKWMLGTAISLAAIGKLDEAKTWADRARDRDAVTPTIAAYLQQLGIVVRQ